MNIEIIQFHESYAPQFKALNMDWILQYFKMEPEDFIVLGNPKKYIIDEGGEILFAINEQNVVGVCALQISKHKKYDYELSKMAVSSTMRGKGIGKLLALAIINLAVSRNAKKIYLESNTILTPAINLYKSLGFKKIEGLNSPYSRSNISMELDLAHYIQS